MKPKVYLETTIVSHLTARSPRDVVMAAMLEQTKKWWASERNRIDLFVSDIVIREASAGDAVPSASATPATPAPAAMSQVDVMSKLEAMAAASPQKSNWKVSIADLLRLLGLDSSLEARKGLAMELGCPKEFIGGDYAQMNMWLHKTVLQRLAANGGNIPKELL